MPELVVPSIARHSAWLDAHREWGPGLHEDGFGLGPDDEFESATEFSAWVGRLHSLPRARTWWIVEGDQVLGGVALRTSTSDAVLRLGHVGYGVRPSARGHGIATWAVGELRPRAREAGLDRLLVVCLDRNLGSIKVIERSGGILDEIVDQGRGPERRYWIDLAPA